MASDDVVRRPTRKVRPRAPRPRSKTFAGFKYLFTTNIASYHVPVFVTRGLISGDAVGFYSEEEQELAIQLPGPGVAAEADRLLHEHLHAISAVCLPPEKRLDEAQVNTISTALIDTLTRNPQLWAFLAQRISPAGPAEPQCVSHDCTEASRTSAGTTKTPQ